MTTIAWDGKRLAADTLITCDAVRLCYRSKIDEVTVGIKRYWIATGGLVRDRVRFIEWFSKGQPPEERPTLEDESFEAMVVAESGSAWSYCADCIAFDVEEREPYAIGSGFKFALGALLAGVDAKRAVEIACLKDTLSGGDIECVLIGSL